MHHDAREGVPVHWSANAAHHRHRPPSPVRRIGHDGEAHPHREQPLRGPRSPSPQRRSPSPQRKHRHGEAYHGPKITALSGGGSRTEVSYMLTEAKTLFLCQSCPCMRMHVKSCIQASLAELPVHMIYLFLSVLTSSSHTWLASPFLPWFPGFFARQRTHCA
jgi:hypothetical protein